MELMTTFENTQMRIVDHDGEQWFTAIDIGRALGYSDPGSSVNRLYERNSEEFQSFETRSVKLAEQGDTQSREYRMFTKSGAKLLAIFAKTERAAAFRRWLIELSEREDKLRQAKMLLGDKVLKITEDHKRRVALQVPAHAELIRLAQAGTPLAIIAEIMHESEFDVQARGSFLAELGFDLPAELAPHATGMQAQPGVQIADSVMMIDDIAPPALGNMSGGGTKAE